MIGAGYIGFRVKGLGFPQIRGTYLGVLIVRTIVFWGLYWVPLSRETTICLHATDTGWFLVGNKGT